MSAVKTAPKRVVCGTGVPRRRAVLFELEYVGLGARDLIHATIAATCARRGVKVSRPVFLRRGLSGTPASFVSRLMRSMGKHPDAIEQITAEVVSDVAAAIERESGGLQPGIQRLLKAVDGRHVVGALSILDQAAAARVCARNGLDKAGVVVRAADASAEGHVPAADEWVRLAGSAGVSPRLCVAIGGCARSCKMALACGMRTFAAPDSSTAFQDFGGCLSVFDRLDAAAIETILGVLDSI